MLAESKKNRTTPFRGAVRRLLGQRYSTGVDDRALTPPSDLIEPSAPDSRYSRASFSEASATATSLSRWPDAGCPCGPLPRALAGKRHHR